MTFLQQHKAHMLVVFAMTAMIGLSSCADTITGSEILKSEDTLQETAPHNTYQKARVLPTPGNALSEFDATTDQPAPGEGALQADWGQFPDSTGDNGAPAPQTLKLIDRY